MNKFSNQCNGMSFFSSPPPIMIICSSTTPVYILLRDRCCSNCSIVLLSSIVMLSSSLSGTDTLNVIGRFNSVFTCDNKMYAIILYRFTFSYATEYPKPIQERWCCRPINMPANRPQVYKQQVMFSDIRFQFTTVCGGKPQQKSPGTQM